MNREQFQYDADVQRYNRDMTIKTLEDKLDMLKQIKAVIYNEGQQDKIKNKRRTTLLEYHKRMDECDIKIDEQIDFIEKLKVMNGYIPRKISIANAPRLGNRIRMPDARTRSKSTSRLKNRYPTPRYPINITKDDAEKYSWVVSSDYLNKLEKIISSNDINSELPEEDDLDKEIEQTEKDLGRARCCF